MIVSRRPGEANTQRGENDQWGQMKQTYQERRALKLTTGFCNGEFIGEVCKRAIESKSCRKGFKRKFEDGNIDNFF